MNAGREHSSATTACTRLLDIIDADRQDLVALCLELGNTPSPHGKELRLATRVSDWLKAAGIESWLQPITSESANAVGLIPGESDGASLIFNAHLDTGPAVPPNAPEGVRKINEAWVEDDLLYGSGVVNDKGQLAAFMIAARAILKAGLRMRGDLIITAVAFETGAPSVGDRQGINYPGEGFGSWWLFNRGVTADYALVGETSGFGLVTAECGELGLEVRLTGRSVYTPRLERGASLSENPSSIVRMAHVVSALEEWAVQYEQIHRLQFAGGTIVPKAQIKAVRGTPSDTVLHLDVRLLPGANPRAVLHDVRRHLAAVGLHAEVRPFQWSRGYIARNAEPLIGALTQSHEHIFGAKPPPPPTSEVSMWRDVNMFNEVGIPSICYGPPRQHETYSDAHDRAMKIDDLVAVTKVYALTALNLCGLATK